MNKRIYKKLSKQAAGFFPGLEWYLDERSIHGKFAMRFPKRERRGRESDYVFLSCHQHAYCWHADGISEWDAHEALDYLHTWLCNHFTRYDESGPVWTGPKKKLGMVDAIRWVRKYGVPNSWTA